MNNIEKCFLACANGNIKAIRKYIEGSLFIKAIPINTIYTDPGSEFTNLNLLMCACKFEREKIVDFLLLNDIHTNDYYPDTMDTALIYAVRTRNIHIIRELLKAEASIWHKNSNGESPISIALKINNKNILKVIDKFINVKTEHIYELLRSSKIWAEDNHFPSKTEYPHYEEVREIGRIIYRKSDFDGLNKVMQYVKNDNTDLYTYLDLLWNHLDVDEKKDVWLM
jgi:ankyrin repeat protein